MQQYRPADSINYLAILTLAIVSAGIMLLSNQGILGWGYSAPETAEIAPAVERLAWLAEQPTPAPPIQSGRLASLRPPVWKIGMPDGDFMVADENNEALLWKERVFFCAERTEWTSVDFHTAAVMEQVCEDMREAKQ